MGLPIFVVVRTVADPAAGHFVLIRSTPQARVVLGCTAGSDGRPLEWLELWVQNTNCLDGADPAYASTATNAAWDTRWRELAQAMHQDERNAIITTPLEHGHLVPAALSVAEKRFAPLSEGRRGRTLALCMDDGILEDAGLPGYAPPPTAIFTPRAATRRKCNSCGCAATRPRTTAPSTSTPRCPPRPARQASDWAARR